MVSAVTSGRLTPKAYVVFPKKSKLQLMEKRFEEKVQQVDELERQKIELSKLLKETEKIGK